MDTYCKYCGALNKSDTLICVNCKKIIKDPLYNYNKNNNTNNHKKNRILLPVVSIGVVALVATMIVILVNNLNKKEIKSSNNSKTVVDDMVLLKEGDKLTEEKWEKIYRRDRFYNYLRDLKMDGTLPDDANYGKSNAIDIENIKGKYKYIIYDFDEDNDEELIVTLQDNGYGEESAIVYDFESKGKNQVFARMMPLSDYNNWKSNIVDSLPKNRKIQDVEEFNYSEALGDFGDLTGCFIDNLENNTDDISKDFGCFLVKNKNASTYNYDIMSEFFGNQDVKAKKYDWGDDFEDICFYKYISENDMNFDVLIADYRNGLVDVFEDGDESFLETECAFKSNEYELFGLKVGLSKDKLEPIFEKKIKYAFYDGGECVFNNEMLIGQEFFGFWFYDKKMVVDVNIHFDPNNCISDIKLRLFYPYNDDVKNDSNTEYENRNDVNIINEKWKEEYANLIKSWDSDHRSDLGELKYSLIYLDDDDIPELVCELDGYYIDVYTIKDDMAYCIMDKWGYGVGGNHGYYFEEREGKVTNINSDFAGAAVWTTVWEYQDYEMKQRFQLLQSTYDYENEEYEEGGDGNYKFFYHFNSSDGGMKKVTKNEYDRYLKKEGKYEMICGEYKYKKFLNDILS